MENNTPLANAQESENRTTAPRRMQRKSNVATDAINKAALAKRVALNLVNYPDIVVGYMDLATFTAKAADYSDLVQIRSAEINSRPTLTSNIKNVIAEAKKGITAIRGYLFEKYEDQKKVVTYYPDFGLIKKGTSWQLPTDQQGMISAFIAIKKGIITHGFGTKKFGTAKFTTLQTEYTAAVNIAIAQDGTSSLNVANKDLLAEEIEMFLTSIRYIVRGQYPKTYTSILRDLGFQKEKL